MKVTGVPEQIVPAGDAEILTLTGCRGATSMITEFEVAGLPVAQVALLVITQITVSLSCNVLLV
ncbi:hypothetical protein SDC9_162645 [bioreactor metagenome]|uniref:Uncharacterized protein n=1 Tax=bioreactor metagenome TaxID=1076179 RepID=A0A645FLN3_9ZZZZ